MKKLYHRLLPLTGNHLVAFIATLAIGFIVMPIAAAVAQVAAQPSTTVDLSPLLNQVVWPVLGTVLTALVGWLITRASTYFHLASQDTIRSYVMTATQNGVAAIEAKLAGTPLTVDTHSAKVAAVASHLITTVPSGLKALGFTLEPNDPKLVAMISAQLNQLAPPPPAAPATAQ
jgi:hypothetical protein